jgi:beta-lactamase class A
MMKKLILLVFVLLMGIGIGGFLTYLKLKSNTNNLLKIRAIRSSQNGLINPLVEYEISSSFYDKALKLFREDIQKVVDEKIKNKQADEIAVYFRSLNNGPWFGIKEDDAFFPASLMKVPLMIAYYKWTEEDPNILKKEIKYDDSYFKMLGNFNDFQYFKSENPIEVGKTYTVEELIERMIINSDNNAKNLLILNLDTPERLFKIYTDLGLASVPELRGTGDILSVHEYATFFRVLYNASYLSKDLSQKALKLLTETNFKQGLVGKLPQDIQIAHKFGEHQDDNDQYKQLHDCGIVYYPSYPYLICFMTRGQSFDDLTKVIQDLSLEVYNNIHEQIQRDGE